MVFHLSSRCTPPPHYLGGFSREGPLPEWGGQAVGWGKYNDYMQEAGQAGFRWRGFRGTAAWQYKTSSLSNSPKGTFPFFYSTKRNCNCNRNHVNVIGQYIVFPICFCSLSYKPGEETNLKPTMQSDTRLWVLLRPFGSVSKRKPRCQMQTKNLRIRGR